MKLLNKIINCYILGSHEWTCNAQEGIKPTKEQLEGDIVKGFKKYAKMYCKRCNKISNLSL